MKRTLALAITVVLIALTLSLVTLEHYSNYLNPKTSPSPTPYVDPYLKPTPAYSIGLSQWQVNVTQGESFQITVTITSSLSQNVTFTPQVQLYAYDNTALDTSKDYGNIYNSTFTQEQIALEPYGNATTVLTINMAQDCQLGRYLFYVGHSSSDTGLGVNVEDALTVFVLPKST